MLALIIFLLVGFIVWTVYGRGAYIVYKYQRDEGVLIPENADKDQVIEMLKKDLGYRDATEIFFDEKGDICIAGKYDTYKVGIINGRAYIDDPFYTEIDSTSGKAFSFIQKLGNFRLRSDKRKDRNRVEELLCIRAYVKKVFDHDAPINAHKKYEEMTRARKYSGIVTAVSIVLSVILIICAVASAMEDQTVDSVKDAYFESYSKDISIGEALEDFFADTTWESFSEGSKDYVKFSGEFLYYDKTALAVITFEFMENDWFRVSKITINGETLSEYEESVFLTVIYDSYGE